MFTKITKNSTQLVLKNSFKKYSNNVPDSLNDIGKNVFSDSVLKSLVKPEVFEAFSQARETGKPIEKAHRNAIATSLQKWATERGCV
jgi:glutamine synthetase type III